MNKMKKSLIISLVSILILLPGLNSAFAVSIQKENTDIEKNENIQTKLITLCRVGLDGSQELIQVEVEIKEGQDLVDAIEEKAIELLEQDPLFTSAINNSTMNSFASIVRSRGRGFHFKVSPTIKIPKNFDLFPLLPPYDYLRISIPIIFCNYPVDQKAYTKITPIIGGNVTLINGPHRVVCAGFYGIKWWIGHISYFGFGLRTGFVGLSLYTNVKS